MVIAFVAGSRGRGSSPGRGHAVVFLCKTLYSHGATPRCIKRYWRTECWVMLEVTLRWTSIQSRNKLRPDVLLARMQT